MSSPVPAAAGGPFRPPGADRARRRDRPPPSPSTPIAPRFRSVFQNGSPVRLRDPEEGRRRTAPDFARRPPRPAPATSPTCWSTTPAALHDRLQAQGVRIIKAIRDADFGLRCFVFADPDGNRIDVGQPLPR